jgi:hypothetical protein
VVRHLPGSCVLSLLLLLLMVAVGWQLVGRGMMETMQRWCFFVICCCYPCQYKQKR